MNTLDYEKALIIDKRTFFQYYLSLIKRKNIIIFTFIPMNDYNLMYMKILVFLISISLYFVVNALFFSDETMHKIYKDKGIFNFIYQLPKVIYSTIISVVINMLIKKLALSEPDIIRLKNEKEEEIEAAKIKTIKCLKIKFNIFLSISLMILILCWYYISVFCATYSNTVIIMLKDTLTSFLISLIYPLFLNILPCCFRIPSLRHENNSFLYAFSKIVAYI